MADPEKRLLLTVFEPFGGSEVNASQVVGQALAAGDPTIDLLCLPVAAGDAERILIERLKTGPVPSMVISLGEAGPEPVIRLEKVALNYDDFRIPDNAGNQPRNRPIRTDGPTAYFANLPLEDVAARLDGETPLPVKVSLTAGAFVCNHLSYSALNWLDENPVCGYAFIHVPRWRADNLLNLVDIAGSVMSVVTVVKNIRSTT